MYGIILTLHVIVCLGLILIVLIQSGKGGNLGIFGGGGTDALFSAPSGSAFIKKATTTLAIVFALTSLILTIFSGKQATHSVIERVGIPQTQGR